MYICMWMYICIFLKWFYYILIKLLINVQKEIQRKVSLLQLYNTRLPTKKEVSTITLSSARLSCLNKYLSVYVSVCVYTEYLLYLHKWKNPVHTVWHLTFLPLPQTWEVVSAKALSHSSNVVYSIMWVFQLFNQFFLDGHLFSCLLISQTVFLVFF